MYLYALLLLGSVLVPFALSFDKKLQFYKQWKYLLPAILAVAAVYIGIDVYMTKSGVWGFNPRYHSDIKLAGLPIEEWLFFILIPYASIFLHDAFVLYFPIVKLNNKFSNVLSISLILFFVVLTILHFEKAYTSYISITTVAVLLFSFFDKSKTINRFYITFLLILIPFLLVNATLTGTFIEDEVVWYNNNENLNIRIITIPIEDFAYGFSLILFGLLVRQKLISIWPKG
jgi:lycopene cyclase domain-containing protein